MKNGAKSEETVKDGTEQAMQDFHAFRDVMSPELQEGFDQAMDSVPGDSVQFVIRALILAISFGRKLEEQKIDEPEKSRIITLN